MPSFFHSEVLGGVRFNDSDHLVTATVEGRFDPGENRVTVHCDAFLRPTDISRKDHASRPPWLPPANAVIEAMDQGEAGPFVADMFANWVRQVRAALDSAGDDAIIHRHH